MASFDLADAATRSGCPRQAAAAERPPLDAPAEGARPHPAAFVRADAKGGDRLELLVKGARCAGCIRKIEGGLLALPEVMDARLNLSTGRLVIRFGGGAARAEEFVRRMAALGYEAQAFDPVSAGDGGDAEGRALLRRLAVAGFAAMNVMMFSLPVWFGADIGPGARALMLWYSALVALPCSIYAAQPFFVSAFAALRRGRANMDVPISLAVVLTLAMSLYETAIGGGHAYFDGVAMLLFLLLIGRALDHRLRQKARTAARELLAMQAVTAHRLNADGAERAIPAREVAPGDRLAIAPGERAPVDAVILEGASELDRALLTGETTPVPARVGDELPAGAVNLTRRLVVRALRRAEDSTVAELARLIELGEQNRAAHRRIVDQAAALYVPVVHALALATFLGWLVAQRWSGMALDPHWALTNAVAVLIITCPCALGLAVPAVQVVATGRLFRQGVFVRSGDALERLAQIDTVALDKTGTLTLGRPRLIGEVDPVALETAARLARASRHPLSRALVAAAGPGPVAAAVEESPGLGLRSGGDGLELRLGSRAFVGAQASPDTHGGAELWLRQGDGAPIRFRFEDRLREDAAETVAALKARGLRVELLSGDRPEAVAYAAAAVGIDVFHGGVSPQEKVARLEALKTHGRRVLMVGDGLNDTAALAAAHVSACPGAAIDASQAASDVVFQGQRLGALVEALDVARAARARVAENLWFSALYNAAAIPVAVFGFVTPLVAAIAMSASSLVVTLNALRLEAKSRQPALRDR